MGTATTTAGTITTPTTSAVDGDDDGTNMVTVKV